MGARLWPSGDRPIGTSAWGLALSADSTGSGWGESWSGAGAALVPRWVPARRPARRGLPRASAHGAGVRARERGQLASCHTWPFSRVYRRGGKDAALSVV